LTQYSPPRTLEHKRERTRAHAPTAKAQNRRQNEEN
jgi:hypothetical protein